MNQNNAKTKELLVYIAHKLADKENSGAILFNKALYFIDNISFLKIGRPISNFKYIKQRLGPTPQPNQFLPLREEVISQGDLVVIESEYFGRKQNRLVPTREPNYELFEKDEIIIIDEVLSEVSSFNGKQISDLTHQFPSWQVAKEMEELPFYTFLLSSKEPNDKDIQWAKEELTNVL